jgi:tRNA uridine 5-carboxymethylaminomethyl modification enzyme
MFTSRAEYRLQLREDNADLRLTEAGRRLGLVDDQRWEAFCEKRDAIEAETQRWRATWANPQRISTEEQVRVLGQPLEREHSLFDLLRRPGTGFGALKDWLPATPPVADVVAEQIEIAAKYAGYIERQRDEIEKTRQHEEVALPSDLDYAAVRGLSKEAQQKLAQHRPATLGHASRIQGITPAAVSLLLVHLKRRAAATEKTA